MACALAESALGDGAKSLGLHVTLDDDLPPVATLFGEAQGRIVLSCAPDDVDALLGLAEDYGVPARRIGTVGEAGGDFSIRLQDASVIRPIQALSDVYFEAIPRIMDAPATSGA